MDDPWIVSTSGRPSFGEGVDGLHYPGVGSSIELGEPVVYLVRDVPVRTAWSVRPCWSSLGLFLRT